MLGLVPTPHGFGPRTEPHGVPAEVFSPGISDLSPRRRRMGRSLGAPRRVPYPPWSDQSVPEPGEAWSHVASRLAHLAACHLLAAAASGVAVQPLERFLRWLCHSPGIWNMYSSTYEVSISGEKLLTVREALHLEDEGIRLGSEAVQLLNQKQIRTRNSPHIEPEDHIVGLLENGRQAHAGGEEMLRRLFPTRSSQLTLVLGRPTRAVRSLRQLKVHNTKQPSEQNAQSRGRFESN